MIIRIDYYTGTGGSRLVAEEVAKGFRTKGHTVYLNRIQRGKNREAFPVEFDFYMVVFAVHSFNAPRPAMEWAGSLEGGGRACAVVSVSGVGEVVSNTACRRKIIALLERRNFRVTYESMVQMPNNWMRVPDTRKFNRLVEQCPAQSVEIADEIDRGVVRRKKPYPIDVAISFLGTCEKWMLRYFGQGIQTTDNCNGCGLCVSRCGSSNIVLENGKALVGGNCDMCLGCIYGCPRQALIATHARFQVDKKGYRLPPHGTRSSNKEA